jgi:hypothetical protein
MPRYEPSVNRQEMSLGCRQPLLDCQICPALQGPARRAAAGTWRRAQWWTEGLIPRVAVRQLVLTVSWLKRLLFARRPELARGVLRCALAEVTRCLRREGVRRGAGGEPGTVTVMQRFGSALTLARRT